LQAHTSSQAAWWNATVRRNRIVRHLSVIIIDSF
jgi:hypothetical protein